MKNFQFNDSKRGQTLPEFALAFGIFFLVILITFSVSYSLFQPFSTTSEQVSEADRVTNQLVQSTFVEKTDQTYVTSDRCILSTVQAFNGEDPEIYPTECGYTSDINSLEYDDYFALSEQRGAQVTIVDDSQNTVVYNSGGDSVELKFGDNIPDQAQTTVSKRFVRVNGSLYQLEVVLW